MDDYEPTDDDSPINYPQETVNEQWKRNLIGFWMLGLCNNFAYVIMLSAAKDILEGETKNATHIGCQEEIIGRECTQMSTGSVLLADILPALFIKISAPFFIQSIPFGTRHFLVVILQALSYILVAFSQDVYSALLGVVLASFASGLGEISYLALASYFKSSVIAAWSSGTGGAGIIGALAYAVLTDPIMLHLTPKNALLTMLVVPALFAITYWCVLVIPENVHRVRLCDPTTYFVKGCCLQRRNSDNDDSRRPLLGQGSHNESQPIQWDFNALPLRRKITAIKRLLRFMVPLTLVYFGEYFINQGMFELLVFDCDHGFGLSKNSQYRWYQVLYQLGVFVSRSSSNILTIPPNMLPLLAVLQLINAVVFFADAWKPFVPHILLVMIAIVYEGLLGGASYVNTFKATHQTMPADRREFSMGFVSISDTVGIVFAGFVAIYAHNFICAH